MFSAVAAFTVAAAAVIATLDAGHVFAVGVVVGIANVTAAVAGFIAMEVVEGSFTAIGEGADVPMVGIVTVVDVAVEVAMAVEPRAGADKHAADEPIGPVVTVRGAVIGFVIVVAIRTYGRSSDADGDLGSRLGHGSAHEERKREGA
jgi:hypothetical protein